MWTRSLAVLTSVFGKQTARQMLADCQLAWQVPRLSTPQRRDFADLSESVPWLGLPPR